MSDTKVCARCRKDVSCELFYGNTKSKDGLASYCKPCVKEYNAASAGKKQVWRKENTKKHKARNASTDPHKDATRRKACSLCKEDKFVTDFPRQASAADGLDSQCKECRKRKRAGGAGTEYSRRYRAKPNVKEALRVRQREFNRTEKAKEIKRQYLQRNPLKNFARRTVQLAVRLGLVVKPEQCGACGLVPAPMADGRSGLHAHHHDYCRPLDVTWLCIECHAKAGVAPTNVSGPIELTMEAGK